MPSPCAAFTSTRWRTSVRTVAVSPRIAASAMGEVVEAGIAAASPTSRRESFIGYPVIPSETRDPHFQVQSPRSDRGDQLRANVENAVAVAERFHAVHAKPL